MNLTTEICKNINLYSNISKYLKQILADFNLNDKNHTYFLSDLKYNIPNK